MSTIDKSGQSSSVLPAVVELLPIVEDPNGFLDRMIELLTLEREIQRFLAEREQRELTIQMAQQQELSRKANRLVAMVLEEAAKKGVPANTLPHLKGMGYQDLVEYIYRQWPDLSSAI